MGQVNLTAAAAAAATEPRHQSGNLAQPPAGMSNLCAKSSPWVCVCVCFFSLVRFLLGAPMTDQRLPAGQRFGSLRVPGPVGAPL